MSLSNIYNKLGMNTGNGLCITRENTWRGSLPRRLELLIKKVLEPDAFFVFDKKPLVFFYDSPLDKKKLFKKVWNFNETPIVIINEVDSIEIYNGFSYLKDEAKLEKLANEDELTNFSYFELVTGKSLENYQSKLKQKNRVDFHLLENIRDARNVLIDRCQVEPSLANALIGKCIFVRYLIDRRVKINFKNQKRYWSPKDFSNILKSKTKTIKFFYYLKNQFNGEAFLLNDNKLNEIPVDAFAVLKDLLEGTNIFGGQLSLFDVYDFSIIPIEFISNVYEFFIGKENQAEQGAYYTPKFLVDYIISETVEKYFNENPDKYNCRVLDPACGSGIFLVETLRRIIERYIELNDISTGTKKFTTALKRITEDNIFGIDEDPNAVNVSVFSIYITLLDYQEPKDIEKFTFPNLKHNYNFNSADFFDLNAEFNSQLSKINFDFIIGNPPWKRGASKDALFLQYIKHRNQKELNKKVNSPECIISNKEIAQAFLLRTSDFSTEKTKCSLIITSKILYNIKAIKFRSYFLHQYFIDKVFELAPVRKEIFVKLIDKTIAPAAILFFRYSHGKNTESNELIHISLKPNRLFSLFKIFILQKADIKRVVQKRLMDFDWLWKVLVYGNYLAFNFLKRLKENYTDFSDIAEKNSFTIGEGIIVGKKGTYDMRSYIGASFIKSEHLSSFFIFYDENSKWDHSFVHRDRRKNKIIFEAPALLISRGISKYFRTNAAILYKDALFTHSLTSIKTDKQNIDILRIANGVMFSDIFSCFALFLASSVGIEREQLHDKEKFNFPFINDLQIAKIVVQIESISKQIQKEKQFPLNSNVTILETKKQDLINLLNNKIFKSFDLNEKEHALVDYAINITIPLIMKHKGYEQKLFSSIPFNERLLNDYINVFLSRFEKSLKEKHLKAEIWYTTNIIGIFFKVLSNNSSYKQNIKWVKKENENLLRKMASLGTEKITENLFIQKDIRGFEKNGFYIIKPNEKKLWHKAIAYLDIDEFMDAILKAGKEVYSG